MANIVDTLGKIRGSIEAARDVLAHDPDAETVTNAVELLTEQLNLIGDTLAPDSRQGRVNRKKFVAITFVAKPDAEVLQELKDLGFRYDGKSREWTCTEGMPRVKDGPVPDMDKAFDLVERLSA